MADAPQRTFGGFWGCVFPHLPTSLGIVMAFRGVNQKSCAGRAIGSGDSLGQPLDRKRPRETDLF
ncbi:uncharacterized protein METZ01_LOCUS223711, partial [marine metagenome]